MYLLTLYYSLMHTEEAVDFFCYNNIDNSAFNHLGSLFCTYERIFLGHAHTMEMMSYLAICIVKIK